MVSDRSCIGYLRSVIAGSVDTHTGHECTITNHAAGSRYRLAIVLLLLLRPHLSFLVPSSFAAGRAPLKAAPRPKPYLGNPTARL
uniref:Uncharacterized protein n=2 Tax=Oryza TaxID=4527 RepID=A0A0E0FVG9_ORYNI